MVPVRIRVTRIMDFGTIVSIVGLDLETNQTVMVHIDHRPFAQIWQDWKALGFPQPITFDAERLTIKLDPELDDDPGDELPQLATESGSTNDCERTNVSA
jgi:hypothetical protein